MSDLEATDNENEYGSDVTDSNKELPALQTYHYKSLTTDQSGVVTEAASANLGYLGLLVTRDLSGPNVAEKLEYVQRVAHQDFVNVQAIFHGRA